MRDECWVSTSAILMSKLFQVCDGKGGGGGHVGGRSSVLLFYDLSPVSDGIGEEIFLMISAAPALLLCFHFD